MRNPQSLWLWAAVVTLGVAAAEAVAILRLIPGTTVIDVGALLVTGFLAGLFLGIHKVKPFPRRHNSDGRQSNDVPAGRRCSKTEDYCGG